MDIAIILVWLSLAIYIVILLKAGIIDKKERKWVYLLVLAAVACSVLDQFNISLNGTVSFLNHTFGKLSRMVVGV